jgi:RNA polymerase sigma-70 factor (ECF subfamily)
VDQAQKRRGEVIGIDEFDDRRAEPVSPAPGPEESAARGQDLALLRRALDRLPADKRELLVLSRFQNMKYEEIAGILDCEPGTVKVRVFRAMRALEQAYHAIADERRGLSERDVANGN